MRCRRIAILGSTGSIGRQALKIIEPQRYLKACALAAGSNWRLLAEQAHAHRPEVVALCDPAGADDLARALPPGTELLTGPDAMVELVRRARADLVLTAMAGSSGLLPTLEAIRQGCDLAIANKESLVMAGALVMHAARHAKVQVLPVDSEHSAVYQCLHGHRRQDVRRVTLTASGGPFRTWPAERVAAATLDEVLRHPTWQMGRKVTIDSATLMNKALEIIEAHWLFELPAEQIEVVIHPESLVHALVEFSDGSVLAQLGPPSMATPISFALHHPRRSPRIEASSVLDLPRQGTLHFEPAEPERFPALALGYRVLELGGTAGAILNAANEVAVEAFVAGRVRFGQILAVSAEVLNQVPVNAEVTVQSVLAADAAARAAAEEVVARM